MLRSSVRQVDPQAGKNWRGLHENSSVRTLLAAAGDAAPLLAVLPHEPHHRISDLAGLDGHIDCCYVGEIGRVGPRCPSRHDALQPVTIGDRSFRVVPTVEAYTWEGNILDCSIGEAATTSLPSAFIQESARLIFDMDGPSWLNNDGAPVFTYYEESGDDSFALLVRATFLKEFLAARKLELIVLHWFDRIEVANNFGERRPYVDSSVKARVSANLTVRDIEPLRTQRGTT